MIKDPNEIKIVNRNQSFDEMVVQEIGSQRAKCLCLLQFKRCKRNECSNCPVNARINNCYKVMSDFDRIRVDSQTGLYYSLYSRDPVSFMPYKGVKKYFRQVYGFLFLVVLACAVFLGVASECGDRPPQPRGMYVKDSDEVDSETSLRIQETILMVQRSIVDVNGDGKKNCCDYAILFYLAWTTFEDNSCELVHNVNPGVMNHLFAQIKDPKTGKIIEIEPWTTVVEDYLMKDAWKPETYDYRYNRYGETEMWLNSCEKRVVAFDRIR